MEVLNFIIGVVALIIAIIAFQRAGGAKDLRNNTAELLSKMEQRLRKKEAEEEERNQPTE